MQSPERLRSDLRAALEGVGGWLDFSEAWALHETARRHLPGEPITIVEVGSYHGRSTIALARGLRARDGGGKVFAVDPEQNEPDQYDLFCKNIERAGLGESVELIRTYSHEARPRFSDASVDILFLDGAHNYGAVKKDIADWQATLRDGAVIAFNDAFWLEGVRLAVREMVAVRRSPFRKPRWRFNTLFLDYLPNARWTALDQIGYVRLRAFLAIGGRMVKLHGWVNSSKRIPKRLKELDFKLLLGTLSVVLPRTR
jgi:predicted O-methyltransferase YrrM